MTPFVAALLVKVTLILSAGLVISAISRGLSPSVRHLVLYACHRQQRAAPSRDVDVAGLECPGVATRILERAFIGERSEIGR